jgi:hypothetical protein
MILPDNEGRAWLEGYREAFEQGRVRMVCHPEDRFAPVVLAGLSTYPKLMVVTDPAVPRGAYRVDILDLPEHPRPSG